MTGIERYGSSGAHTVEGNVAGPRAAKLTKKRDEQKKEYEAKRQDIEQTNRRGTRIDANFQSHQDDDESEFKARWLGNWQSEQQQKEPKVKKKKRKAKKMGPLSFDMDGDEDGADEVEIAKPKRVKKSIKNPNVETDFLPDKEREKEEARERQQLRAQWEEEQERIKNENVAVTYSYWDGSGHRREITVPKKTTIGKYLELIKQQLVSEFAELRGVGAENLIYIKEDLIIPHHYSFYDLIVTKARGKSGPLFHFDVHDDVRLVQDRRVEKDESHPGKVVDRHWYEKNKHIFPASRWEVYDPNVVREKYTIHGD
ncbi:Protein fam50a [Phytophthora pseudosyringae]|uniref:Protein fam50a n=1 Tax=Phytophthora pseudosyringae TaxID=221518 RepID=A0A8T1VNX6_9STRA|nr:Protein fam50a [Phytophthora pseudosyringae]